MAEPSRTTWASQPDAPRVCSGCHERLRITGPQPLWFEGATRTTPARSWHFTCRIAAHAGRGRDA